MSAMLARRVPRTFAARVAPAQARLFSDHAPIGSSLDEPGMPIKRTTFQNYLAVTNGQEAIKSLQEIVKSRDPDQKEFNQAVEEVMEDLEPVFDRNMGLVPVFRYIMEPERVVKFRVPWLNDDGVLRVNRGYRVQYSSALGPYKGGLRFHPTVTESVVKFLGFEQVFKNALTTLPMGGGKGGCDFDPKGKSEAEVVRFCQSFMTELSHYIGRLTDVPAGDIGVGGREIGYMFGQYKRMTRLYEGVLTGKGMTWGGSLIRPEATGYGCVFFARCAIESRGGTLEGARCAISGAGNVAQYTAEKLLQLGAIPVSFSDSSGTIHEPNGFTKANLDDLMHIKNVRRERIRTYVSECSTTAVFKRNVRPWDIPCDYAFPSATQNEVSGDDAKTLVKNGCKGVFEGANMPCAPEAIPVFQDAKIIFAPGKAANAGGVAVSGLEMAQNASMINWERDVVENKLLDIMTSIHTQCEDAAETYGRKGDLKFGANVAGFLKVATAVQEQGV